MDRSVNFEPLTPTAFLVRSGRVFADRLAMAFQMRFEADSVYLWTLPMFHCNGWCFTWGVTAAGAVHLCLRKLDPALIWKHLRRSHVSHFCAARGYSKDTPLEWIYRYARQARLVDGASEVHKSDYRPSPALE